MVAGHCVIGYQNERKGKLDKENKVFICCLSPEKENKRK